MDCAFSSSTSTNTAKKTRFVDGDSLEVLQITDDHAYETNQTCSETTIDACIDAALDSEKIESAQKLKRALGQNRPRKYSNGNLRRLSSVGWITPTPLISYTNEEFQSMIGIESVVPKESRDNQKDVKTEGESDRLNSASTNPAGIDKNSRNVAMNSEETKRKQVVIHSQVEFRTTSPQRRQHFLVAAIIVLIALGTIASIVVYVVIIVARQIKQTNAFSSYKHPRL